MSNYDECDAEASKLLYLYLNGGEPGGVSIHKRIAALLRAERSDPNEWVDPPRTLPAPPPPPQWIFVPTGEVRVPKKGEWWGAPDRIYLASGQELDHHPIYRRVSVEELKCPGHIQDGEVRMGPEISGTTKTWALVDYKPASEEYRKGWNACLAKLGIKP